MSIPVLELGYGPLQSARILAANAGSTGDITISASTLSSASAIPLLSSGDTDDYFTFATVSNIPTIYGTGSYVRIGDAAATSHALASEDDLMVSGKVEVDGDAFLDGTLTTPYLNVQNATSPGLTLTTDGSSMFSVFTMNHSDANAITNLFRYYGNSGNFAPVWVYQFDDSGGYEDFGLFDGLTQPLITILEKANQLHSATNGIADAGAASAILKHVGGFTAAVVGDIVRITAGTLCTAGWYWITTVTSADQVTLDRNYTSGDTTNVTFVTFHNFPMIGADGVCLKCFDGAPGDANTEIDRDGWLQLDVSQANGRLYWRGNSAWHYVDATAGFGIPTNETECPICNQLIEVGQAVAGQINQKLSDDSLHGLWCHLNCLRN